MIIELGNNIPDAYEKNFRIFCFKIVNGFAHVTGDQMYVAADERIRPFINKDAVYHIPKDWYELVCYDTAEFNEEFFPVLAARWLDEASVKQPVMRVTKDLCDTVLISEAELKAAGFKTELLDPCFNTPTKQFQISKHRLNITPAVAG